MYKEVYAFLKKRIKQYLRFGSFKEHTDHIKLAEAHIEVSRRFRTLDFCTIAPYLQKMITLEVKSGIAQRNEVRLWIYHYWFHFAKGDLRQAKKWIEKKDQTFQSLLP